MDYCKQYLNICSDTGIPIRKEIIQIFQTLKFLLKFLKSITVSICYKTVGQLQSVVDIQILQYVNLYLKNSYMSKVSKLTKYFLVSLQTYIFGKFNSCKLDYRLIKNSFRVDSVFISVIGLNTDDTVISICTNVKNKRVPRNRRSHFENRWDPVFSIMVFVFPAVFILF